MPAIHKKIKGIATRPTPVFADGSVVGGKPSGERDIIWVKKTGSHTAEPDFLK
jgi:hypothetical protein